MGSCLSVPWVDGTQIHQARESCQAYFLGCENPNWRDHNSSHWTSWSGSKQKIWGWFYYQVSSPGRVIVLSWGKSEQPTQTSGSFQTEPMLGFLRL